MPCYWHWFYARPGHGSGFRVWGLGRARRKRALSARVCLPTNPPQGHPITTLKALKVSTTFQTHRPTHAPWLPSRHQDQSLIALGGMGWSSKLPIRPYRNTSKIHSGLRPETICAEGLLHRSISQWVRRVADLAGYFAETHIGFA